VNLQHMFRTPESDLHSVLLGSLSMSIVIGLQVVEISSSDHRESNKTSIQSIDGLKLI
jgi:hypothetical protein